MNTNSVSRDGVTINQRLRLRVRGAVQGVGFRPYVYHLATELGLCGFVSNSPEGVIIEVDGNPNVLREFLLRLPNERPPHCVIHGIEPVWLDHAGYPNFVIGPSIAAASEGESRDGLVGRHSGRRAAVILPDIATCPQCVREVFDPADRRHKYPFTNCTHCGPRYTIVEALPYDRANTAMRRFEMCPECEKEYDNPASRRFHAQPNACPQCGPQLELWKAGRPVAHRGAALSACADALRAGQIAAVKGLGGFHLLVDAANDLAVRRLRRFKHREDKPFAVMFPSLDAVRAYCAVDAMEQRLLCSPEAPIVLLRRKPEEHLAPSVAPANPLIGALLPYTPLHHLLLADLQQPLVATSGNLGNEPICIAEDEAFTRLHTIADVFLVHDRPIVRHVDDSVVRVMLGRELVLRRARGYAPLPVTLKEVTGIATRSVLGVGAHLKGSVALSVGPDIFVSQHIGDLDTPESLHAFEQVAADMQDLFDAPAQEIAADAHPDYLSTQFARAQSLPTIAVQHHYAHILSCMAENEVESPALGVAWDGTGFGLDGTIWGGEFLTIAEDGFERLASLLPFSLPGGDFAAREPRRSAVGLLYAALGNAAFEQFSGPSMAAFEPAALRILQQMLEQQTKTPATSSAGRLFDGVASLAGLRQVSRFEGQAAMELEFAAERSATTERYEFALISNASAERNAPALHLDWRPMVRAIVADVAHGKSAGVIAGMFHNTLAAMIVAVANRQACRRIVLSGGCFQNRPLAERTVHALEAAGFRPYWHQRIPPNDGGVALGQVAAVLRHNQVAIPTPLLCA